MAGDEKGSGKLCGGFIIAKRSEEFKMKEMPIEFDHTRHFFGVFSDLEKYLRKTYPEHY